MIRPVWRNGHGKPHSARPGKTAHGSRETHTAKCSIEGSAIITASCIPSLKPLLDRITGRFQRSSQRLSDRDRVASSRTRSRSKRTRTERTLFCIGSPTRDKQGDDEEIILQDCPSPASIQPDGAIIITRDYTVVREVATEDTPVQEETDDRNTPHERHR